MQSFNRRHLLFFHKKATLNLLRLCRYPLMSLLLLLLWQPLTYGVSNACTDQPIGSNSCDISILSDDFENNITLIEWLQRSQEEGESSQLNSLNINSGQLNLSVDGGFWYQSNLAPLLYKELAGDFMITTQLRAALNTDTNLPPTQRYNSVGLMVRDPASVNGLQNYVMLDVGTQWDATGTLTRNTNDSSTQFQFQPGGFYGQLRICRIGTQYHLLSQVDGSNTWLEVANYQRNDLPSLVQAGIVINAWQSPSDMYGSFESVIFATPSSLSDCINNQSSGDGDGDGDFPLVATLLSDEFTNPSTLYQWQRLHEVENRPPQYTSLTIEPALPPNTDGFLQIQPINTGWYMTGNAPFLFKSISGNFIISSQLSVSALNNPFNPPGSHYNSAGVMVRNPSSTSNNENWLMVVTGLQGGWLGTFAEQTIQSVTSTNGLVGSLEGEVRICRLDNIFHLFRRLEGDTDWILLDSYERADMPAELQAGIIANAWSGPADINAQFDYVRYAIPETLEDCSRSIISVPENNHTLLNDEFNDSNNLLIENNSSWQVLGNPDDVRADVIDISQSINGWMVIQPTTFPNNGWYQDFYGPLVYKNVTGNFAAAIRLRVVDRNNTNNPPNVGFNAGGFVIRDPAGTHNNDENWLMYNMGAQTNPGASYAREVKKTQNSVSNLFLTEQIGLEEHLLVCRIGSEFYFYYWADAINDWRMERVYNQAAVDGIVTNTLNFGWANTPELGQWPVAGESTPLFFSHETMPETVQLGIMGHAYFQGNTEAQFDYVRFAADVPQVQSECTAAFQGLGNE